MDTVILSNAKNLLFTAWNAQSGSFTLFRMTLRLLDPLRMIHPPNLTRSSRSDSDDPIARKFSDGHEKQTVPNIQAQPACGDAEWIAYPWRPSE